MLTRTRFVCVVMTIAVFCTGCGGSSTSANSATAYTAADDQKDATSAARRGLSPSNLTAVVTFHVKDMGTRLNLL